MGDVAELATFVSFVFLAALLIYVILQVPLAAREAVIDLRERAEPARPPGRARIAMRARLVLVDVRPEGMTVDGVATATGEPFTFEVGRPEGWDTTGADMLLEQWADSGDVVDVMLQDGPGSRHVWFASREAAIDLPVGGVVGAFGHERGLRS